MSLRSRHLINYSQLTHGCVLEATCQIDLRTGGIFALKGEELHVTRVHPNAVTVQNSSGQINILAGTDGQMAVKYLRKSDKTLLQSLQNSDSDRKVRRTKK